MPVKPAACVASSRLPAETVTMVPVTLPEPVWTIEPVQNSYAARGPTPDYDQPPSRRGRSKAAVAIWLVALIAVISVGAIGYAATKDPVLFGLAEAPDPTRRPNLLAMASPKAVAPTPSATATPPPASPSASSGPAARFAALAADPNVSFHLEADAIVRIGTVRMRMSTALDQVGADFALDMSLRMDSRAASMKVIVKDDVAYTRTGDGEWTRVGDPAELDIPAGSLAFSQLKTDQAVLVRSVTRRGNELHLLRVPSTVATGVDPAELERFGCDTDNLALDLWVLGDGTPVTATFAYTCDYQSSSGLEKMTASASYEWSRVGRPGTIKVPAKFR